MNHANNQKFERFSILTIEEAHTLILSDEDRIEYAPDVSVNISLKSMRLRTFLTHGLHCAEAGCSHEGAFYAIERDAIRGLDQPANYHLNLYSVAEDDSEMLMTHDHILARGLGGKDTLVNTQTMCFFHNAAKGALESQKRNQQKLETRSASRNRARKRRQERKHLACVSQQQQMVAGA